MSSSSKSVEARFLFLAKTAGSSLRDVAESVTYFRSWIGASTGINDSGVTFLRVPVGALLRLVVFAACFPVDLFPRPLVEDVGEIDEVGEFGTSEEGLRERGSGTEP